MYIFPMPALFHFCKYEDKNVSCPQPLTFWLGGQAEKRIAMTQISCRLTGLWNEKNTHMNTHHSEFLLLPLQSPLPVFWGHF